MDLNTLRYFLVIAEEQHVTRAAERLQIAQPNLTRIMRKLEQELGFELFDRSNKHQFALTPAGQHVLTEMIPVLYRYERIVGTARRIARGEKGKLVLGYTSAAVFSVLPPILQQYRQHGEIIARDLSTTSHSSVMQALREGRLDVVLFPALDEKIPGVAHVCVATSPLCVVLPTDHPLTSLEAVPLATLAEETWISTPRYLLSRLSDAFLALCQQAGFEPQMGPAASQAHAVVSLVAAHAGIACVTRWAERHIQPLGVVYRPLANVTYQIELHLLWREGEASSQVQTFLQVAQEVSAKYAADDTSNQPDASIELLSSLTEPREML